MSKSKRETHKNQKGEGGKLTTRTSIMSLSSLLSLLLHRITALHWLGPWQECPNGPGNVEHNLFYVKERDKMLEHKKSNEGDFKYFFHQISVLKSCFLLLTPFCPSFFGRSWGLLSPSWRLLARSRAVWGGQEDQKGGGLGARGAKDRKSYPACIAQATLDTPLSHTS